jgi:hypothetical protein
MTDASTAPVPVHHRLLRVAFVAGPALLVASALSFVAGVGLIPPGHTSWVEGVLGAYALALFVPIYLELSRRLATTHRKLGAVTAVTGLLGATCGFAMELARPLEHVLRARGAGDAVWQAFYADPGGEYLAAALLGPLFPLTSILLGVGFLRARTLPRWVAACLIAAGVGFPLAQVGGLDWALHYTYPGATVLWLAALGWIGVRVLGAPREAPAAASAPTRSLRAVVAAR